MMLNKKAKIYEELTFLCVMLGAQQDQRRLIAYSEHLERFDLKAVTDCLKALSTSERYFPPLSIIIEKLAGIDVATEDVANQIASDIISSISRFGSYQAKEAKEFLGQKYLIVERFGGWRSLCEIDNNSISTTRAQLRELAKAFVNASKKSVKESISNEIMGIENNTRELNRVDFGGLLNGKS